MDISVCVIYVPKLKTYPHCDKIRQLIHGDTNTYTLTIQL